MTAPRPGFPDRYLFITRRRTQRQFLLRPDDETNNAFTYLLAEAAQRFGLELVLSQMLSNLHHTILYDPNGREVRIADKTIDAGFRAAGQRARHGSAAKPGPGGVGDSARA